MSSNLTQSRVFYGWYVVGATFVIALYVGGVVFYGFTSLIKPIADEMGWSYAQISLAASLRGLEMSLLAPLTGILVDRWGPRRVLWIGVATVMLGLVLLGRANNLVVFYSAFLITAVGMSSAGQTVLMATVANWFKKRVSFASGIAVSGFGAGGLLVPLIVRLVELYQWRTTVTILGFGMLVVVLPLTFLVRDRPERYGYLPDGEVKVTDTAGDVPDRPQPVEARVSYRQLLRSRTFWCIALAYTGHAVMTSATITHVMPYLNSIGIATVTSGLVASAVPILSIGGRLGFGWLGDKKNMRLLVVIVFAMMGLGLLFFGYADVAGIWALVPFLFLFGVGYGGNMALRAAISRHYFGRANFGAIFGLVVGISLLGTIIGTPLAGWVFDSRGSYHPVWFIFAGLAVAAIISILSLPPDGTKGSG